MYGFGIVRLAMSGKKTNAVAANKHDSSYQLPAVKTLLGGNSLGEELKLEGKSLSFIKNPKRASKNDSPHTKEADWSSLEQNLQNNVSNITSSIQQEVRKSQVDDSKWYEIPKVSLTPELERDLRIIENRQHLDPKRFYKSTGTGRQRGQLPTKFHIGTVVVGSHEFYSGRLTRQERKSRIIDEVLADNRIVNYTRKRMTSLQRARQTGKRTIDPSKKFTKWKRH